MKSRTILAALAATLTGLSAAAQSGCPKERATPVQSRVVTGATQDCGGITIAIQGVQIHEPSQGCPLFIIYEPPHTVPGPSELDTRVELIEMLDIVKMTFECRRSWFLFIPYDNSCRSTGTKTYKTLPLFITVSCEPTAST